MVIDGLLRLIGAQSADALVLPAGEPPYLEKGGDVRPLSMPPLPEEMSMAVLEEVTTAEQRADLAEQGRLGLEYAMPSGERFAVSIESDTSGLRFVFRRPGTEAPPAAAPSVPAPVAAPTPGPTAAAAPSAAPAVDEILQRAAHETASDIFVSSGRDVHLRVGGELVRLTGTRFDEAAVLALAGPELDEAGRRALDEAGSLDLSLVRTVDARPQRYRLNLFRHVGGLAGALRPIRQGAPTLHELGLPDELHSLTAHRHGLVLMTGTAGSGKSTTLVALIERINQSAAKHVITIEDPIEYTYGPGQALIHQREVGRDVENFGAGLRAALRESPDVILVGEMRDRDTIAAALTAAETGHLVLSTLHCGHAAMAIDRIIDVFEPHQQAQVRLQLASVVRAIVTQVLLPSTRPPARVPAFEKLVVNTAVAAKIREGRGHQLQTEIQKGRAEGMSPLEASLARLVLTKKITMATSTATATDPQLLASLTRG